MSLDYPCLLGLDYSEIKIGETPFFFSNDTIKSAFDYFRLNPVTYDEGYLI